MTALDKALRARFLQVSVRADRGSWLAWAQTQNLHPGVMALAHAHERILDDVPPRTWTYTSDLLKAFTPAELEDGVLVRDALGGYLPAAWGRSAGRIEGDLGDERRLRRARAPRGIQLRIECRQGDRGVSARGKTDRIDEIVHRIAPLLAGPRPGGARREGQLTLSSLEALFADLPGDQREKLQEALGRNPTVTTLIDLDPTDLLSGFSGTAGEKKLASWRGDPQKQHRVALAITALRAFIEQPSRLAEMKRSNHRAPEPRPHPDGAPRTPCDAARRDVEARRHHAGPPGRLMSAAVTRCELETWLEAFVRDPAFLEAYPYYAAILAKMTPVADPR